MLGLGLGLTAIPILQRIGGVLPAQGWIISGSMIMQSPAASPPPSVSGSNVS